MLEADSGAAALRALQVSSRPVDAIVLDYRLPDTNNLSLLGRIRHTASRIPVILMTASVTPELVEDALRLGAYCVMDKPFEMNELEGVVSRACEPR